MLFVSCLQQCHSTNMPFSFQGPQLGLRLSWTGATLPGADVPIAIFINYRCAQKFKDACKKFRTWEYISGNFRTPFKITGKRPGLLLATAATWCKNCRLHLQNFTRDVSLDKEVIIKFCLRLDQGKYWVNFYQYGIAAIQRLLLTTREAVD